MKPKDVYKLPIKNWKRLIYEELQASLTGLSHYIQLKKQKVSENASTLWTIVTTVKYISG